MIASLTKAKLVIGYYGPPIASCNGYSAACEVQESERKRETMHLYTLKLYVTGRTLRSERAITNLRQICEAELQHHYELIIIDVLERPQLAEDEKIFATPTLIKELPPPLRRIIGDLSDRDKVLIGLDILPRMGMASHVGGDIKEFKVDDHT